MIEYVTEAWNPYTGCLHGEAECPVFAECWARDMSHRFKQVCGGDFRPRFHPDRMSKPLHWHKRRRVAVCFMGDLFGAWDTAINANSPHLTVLMRWLRHLVVTQVVDSPQHTFLFLTKAPAQYAQIAVWPPNAHVGITLTGAETPEQQAAMWAALERVQGAGGRWLSYEPAIARLAQPIPDWLGWLVVGGWSQRKEPSVVGLQEAIGSAVKLGIPYWVKDNLAPIWTPWLRDRRKLPSI